MESARSIGDKAIAQINTLVERLNNYTNPIYIGPYTIEQNEYGWYVYDNNQHYLRVNSTFQAGTDFTGPNPDYFNSLNSLLQVLYKYIILNHRPNWYFDHIEELSKKSITNGSFYAITIPLMPGNHKIHMIKMYREFTCAGLKFSKASVEANKYWFPCETVARAFFAAVWKDGIIADLSAWTTVPNA